MALGGDTDWLTEPDAVVVERLAAEVAELRGASPDKVLGIAPDAEFAVVRAAFLALTKRFHPARFARRSPEVVRQANELFLVIKSAYARGSIAGGPAGTAPAAEGPVTATPSASNTQPLRGETIPPLSADSQLRAAIARRRRQYARAQTPPVGSPTAAPRTPPLGSPTERTSGPHRRPANPSLPPAGGSQPPTAPIITTTVEAVTDKVRQREEAQRERFNEAVRALKAGQLASARETFRALALEQPHEKRFRLYLAYATGRGHHAAGAVEEARAEYQRALGLDPAFQPARDSLALLDDGEKKKDGLLSRWFRK